MSTSDSDLDDLFVYSGKDKIQEKFRNKLPVDTTVVPTTERSIFNSDDEETEISANQKKTPSKKGKKRGRRSGDQEADCMEVNPPKSKKFDPTSFLQEIQNESLKEATRRQSELKIVDNISRDANRLINSMEQTERQLELQKQKRLQRVDSMPEDTIAPVVSTPIKSVVTSGTPPKSVVEFLEGDELQQAIDGNCEEVDGKVTLILRASGDEEKKLAFRIPKNAHFEELLNVLPFHGYANCNVIFDGESLNPKATPEGMDVEDLDIFDVEPM